MSGFDLEKRAEELFPPGTLHQRLVALQLAREALEAVEAKFRSRSDETDEVEAGKVWSTAADIIRSFIEKPGAATQEVLGGVAGRDPARDTPPPASTSARPWTVYDEELRDERDRQDAKWGGPAHDDTHTPKDWLRFISDHWYEARAAHIDSAHPEYRRELLVIEALARAARESFDRVRGAAAWRRAADTLDGMGQPYERATISHAKPGAQEERAPRVQSSPDASHGERVSADAPPAPLSDAEILERSAMLLDHANLEGGFICTSLAAKLRAAEEPDIFDAFGSYSYRSHSRIHDDARDWFGPLVNALESIGAEKTGGYSAAYAQKALSALRERARAARGGGA